MQKVHCPADIPLSYHWFCSDIHFLITSSMVLKYKYSISQVVQNTSSFLKPLRPFVWVVIFKRIIRDYLCLLAIHLQFTLYCMRFTYIIGWKPQCQTTFCFKINIFLIYEAFFEFSSRFTSWLTSSFTLSFEFHFEFWVLLRFSLCDSLPFTHQSTEALNRLVKEEIFR